MHSKHLMLTVHQALLLGLQATHANSWLLWQTPSARDNEIMQQLLKSRIQRTWKKNRLHHSPHMCSLAVANTLRLELQVWSHSCSSWSDRALALHRAFAYSVSQMVLQLWKLLKVTPMFSLFPILSSALHMNLISCTHNWMSFILPD